MAFLLAVNHFVLISGVDSADALCGNIFDRGIDLNQREEHLPVGIIMSNINVCFVFEGAISRTHSHDSEWVISIFRPSLKLIIRFLSNVHHGRIIEAWTKNICDNEVFCSIKMQFFVVADSGSRCPNSNNFFPLWRVNINPFVDTFGDLDEKVVLRADRLFEISLAELGFLNP